MLKARFGTDLDSVVRRVFPFVARLRVKPDTLTVAGGAASALAAFAFAFDHTLAAGLAMLVAGFFDLIDGVVARSQGNSSPAGGFFDSVMDRLSDMLVFSGIAVAMAARADVAGVALVCWALIGSVMTSYVRARAERHIEGFSVGIMERGERCAILILGALTGYVVVALWAVAIGATITTVQRVVVARRLLRAASEPAVEVLEEAS